MRVLELLHAIVAEQAEICGVHHFDELFWQLRQQRKRKLCQWQGIQRHLQVSSPIWMKNGSEHGGAAGGNMVAAAEFLRDGALALGWHELVELFAAPNPLAVAQHVDGAGVVRLLPFVWSTALLGHAGSKAVRCEA